MNKRPLLVGITGGIGSGKSTVCKIFSALGIPVYDADSNARWIMENDPEVIAAVIKNFGVECYKEGKLQREYLSKIVFPDPVKLNILNGITHPAVAKHFEKWVNSNADFPYLIKEAALFIESGSYKLLDIIILVSASEETRIERVLLRDKKRSREEIKLVISRQMADAEKRKFAQFEIVNNNESAILKKVLDLDLELRNKKLD